MDRSEEKQTESGLEEFIIAIGKDGGLWMECRADSDGTWNYWGAAHRDWVDTIVKAYAPEDWQMMDFKPDWLDCVIIGYCERRLTQGEEFAIRDFVARYWDLPF